VEERLVALGNAPPGGREPERLSGFDNLVDVVAVGGLVEEQNDSGPELDSVGINALENLVDDEVRGVPLGIGLASGKEGADLLATAEMVTPGDYLRVVGEAGQRIGRSMVIDRGQEGDKHVVAGAPRLVGWVSRHLSSWVGMGARSPAGGCGWVVGTTAAPVEAAALPEVPTHRRLVAETKAPWAPGRREFIGAP
jgi:hypothetical protein